MCGRAYETYTEEELNLRYINERAKRRPLGLKPNYNLAPTQTSPVIVNVDGEVKAELMRWGLVPFWAKDVKSASKFSLINARGEEIEQKRSYKQVFERRRCIVPLSGFYEWHRPKEGAKRPYAIHLKDELIMSVAGVWEHWQSKETGEEVDSFSIVTTQANSVMAKIHDRMPVILDRKDEAKWLESKEVSTLVNSPKNNRPEVLKPVE